jgi:anti-anti-sigma factor
MRVVSLPRTLKAPVSVRRRLHNAPTAKKKNGPMFEIRCGSEGEVLMVGRLDATQCDTALSFLAALPAAPGVIDLAGLEYIASAGLRVILLTQKRAKTGGSGVRLINVRPQIYDIFRYAGFDRIIELVRAET